MGRLRKVSHKDVLEASSIESADPLQDPFVPNDFAEDGSNCCRAYTVIYQSFTL